MNDYREKMSDGQTIAYKLLGMLHHIAPNKQAQEACTEAYRDFEKDSLSQKSFDCYMSTVLTSGYLYGNWPWTSKPKGD